MSEDPERKIFDFENLPRLPKEPWEMTLREFDNYAYLLLRGFPDKPRTFEELTSDEFIEAQQKATSVEGIRARREFIKARFVLEDWRTELDSEIDQMTGYDSHGASLMQRLHRHLIEDAVENGKDVPAAVLADYPQLAKRRYERDVGLEKQRLINEQIVSLINDNFDRLDRETGRDDKRMVQNFEKLISDLGLEGVTVRADRDLDSIILTDIRTNLHYIAPFINSRISKNLIGLFDFVSSKQGVAGNSGYPILRREDPAVVYDAEFGKNHELSRVAIRMGRVVTG